MVATKSFSFSSASANRLCNEVFISFFIVQTPLSSWCWLRVFDRIRMNGKRTEMEVASVYMDFVTSSIGERAATILATYSNWYEVNWIITCSVAYAASAIFCSSIHCSMYNEEFHLVGSFWMRWCWGRPRFSCITLRRLCARHNCLKWPIFLHGDNILITALCERTPSCTTNCNVCAKHP